MPYQQPTRAHAHGRTPDPTPLPCLPEEAPCPDPTPTPLTPNAPGASPGSCPPPAWHANPFAAWQDGDALLDEAIPVQAALIAAIEAEITPREVALKRLKTEMESMLDTYLGFNGGTGLVAAGLRFSLTQPSVRASYDRPALDILADTLLNSADPELARVGDAIRAARKETLVRGGLRVDQHRPDSAP